MIIRAEKINIIEPKRGDYLIDKKGNEYMLLQNYLTDLYTVCCLNGKIYYEWFGTIEEIINKFNIVEVIKKENIEIREIIK